MRIPLAPPSLADLMDQISGDRFVEIVTQLQTGPYDAKGRYLHWDKLRHLPQRNGLTAQECWLGMRMARNSMAQLLPFSDKQACPFRFTQPAGVLRELSWIDQNATGSVRANAAITDPKTKDTYLISSLIEEAITSSQLEGAATTRRVAKDMIRSGRKPRDHSEQMIYNNYNAMQFIRDYADEAVTPDFIFELHRLLTIDTLAAEDKDKAGAFRSQADQIIVSSADNKVLHIPPAASELSGRLQAVCDFINDDSSDSLNYIHPVIKAIVVHFMIGYDHPFVDGNGRTARALFYLVLAKAHYWLIEYISISRVIKKSPGRYLQAYLHTETDGGDVTYFIIHQLEVICQAINDLHSYLIDKTRELNEARNLLDNSALKDRLNHRQLTLINNALSNPGMEYTVSSHMKSHATAYQTARSDLLELSDELGVLRRYKAGKKMVFVAPPDLGDLVSRISDS